MSYDVVRDMIKIQSFKELREQNTRLVAALTAAFKLHEYIAGAYVLSLSDFRYLNQVSTEIKEALQQSTEKP